MNETNGNNLPPNRQAIADAAATAFQVEYQTVASQRDQLQVENVALKSELAIQKELYEIASARINEMESRVNSAVMTRDEAVGKAVEARTVLSLIAGTCRTFEIEHGPIIKDTTKT